MGKSSRPNTTRNANNINNTNNASNNTPAAADERRQRQAQAMLRTGVTGFAMLAGLACYLGTMALFRFGQLAAGITGLVFALLVWIAARSLLHDLLVEAARRQTEANRQPQQRTTRQPRSKNQ